MADAAKILAGTDAQLARAVKTLADRTTGAGLRDASPKAGRELADLVAAAQRAGDDRVIRRLAADDLRDVILFAADQGDVGFLDALLRAGVPATFTTFGLRPIVNAAKAGQVAAIETLVRAGESPGYAGYFDKPVAVYAAEQKRLEAVRTLVRLGADVHARDGTSGTTVLVAAAPIADAKLVRLILDRGADADAPDDDGTTPLMAAAAVGNLPAVRELIGAKANVNAAKRLRPIELIDAENRSSPFLADKTLRRIRAKRKDPLTTPLMLAAANGHAAVAEALLAAGANPDARDASDRTAADYADANGHATVLRVLRGGPAGGRPETGIRDLLAAAGAGDLPRLRKALRTGTNPDATVAVRYEGTLEDGVTPTGGRPALVIAAERGDLPIVEELLHHGAGVDAFAKPTLFDNGQAALHAATQHGHTAVVRALLAAGANPGARELGRKGSPGRTAHQIAAQHKRIAILNLLLAATAPRRPAQPKRRSVPGLHEAVQRGDEAMTRRLLDAGAGCNTLARGTRWSPLMYAGFMGHAKLAAFLLDVGAEVNLCNRLGQTALTVTIHGATMAPDVKPHERARRDYGKTVGLLLARGADVNVDSWDGRTPLGMAEQDDLHQIAKLLRSAGAERAP